MVLRLSSMIASWAGPMSRSVPLGSQRRSIAFGLLVGGALPRRVRVTEVDGDAERLFDVG